MNLVYHEFWVVSCVECVDKTAADSVCVPRQPGLVHPYFSSPDSEISVEIVWATIAAIQIRSALDPLHFAQNTATICTTILAPNNYLLPNATQFEEDVREKMQLVLFQWHGNEVGLITTHLPLSKMHCSLVCDMSRTNVL